MGKKITVKIMPKFNFISLHQKPCQTCNGAEGLTQFTDWRKPLTQNSMEARTFHLAFFKKKEWLFMSSLLPILIKVVYFLNTTIENI